MRTISIPFNAGCLALLFGSSFAAVPTNGLVGEFTFSGNANDSSTLHNNASIHGATLTTDRYGNAASAYAFDGVSAYIEIPDNDAYSIVTTQALTISVWMRPDTLEFPSTETDNYVHWVGKGVSGAHEWVFRMYSFTSSRPNRISSYAFNLSGGLGAGSYVQETVVPKQWIHLVARFNYPADQIRLYKDGVQKDEDTFSGYTINPQNGSAPVRLGTRDMQSYFQGAIDDLRIYNRVLTDAEITDLYNEPNPYAPVKSLAASDFAPQAMRAVAIPGAQSLRIHFSAPTLEILSGGIYATDGAQVQGLEIKPGESEVTVHCLSVFDRPGLFFVSLQGRSVIYTVPVVIVQP